MEMSVKFINAHYDEPYYKYTENEDINGIMKLMMANDLDFPRTSSGFTALLAIYAKDRAANVSEKVQIEHICKFLGVSPPQSEPLGTHDVVSEIPDNDSSMEKASDDNSPPSSGNDQVFKSPSSFLRDFVSIKEDVSESPVTSMTDAKLSDAQLTTLSSTPKNTLKTSKSLGAKGRPVPLPRKHIPSVDNEAAQSSDSSKTISDEKENKATAVDHALQSHTSPCQPSTTSSNNVAAQSFGPPKLSFKINSVDHNTSAQSLVSSGKQNSNPSECSVTSSANTSLTNFATAPSRRSARFTGQAAVERLRRQQEEKKA